MHRAFGTFLAGIGVTVASTFASSLGLSLDQQRIGFGIGIFLILVGGALYAYGRRNKAAKEAAADHPSDEADAVAGPHSLDSGEFPRRDDRGELAQKCHMLAGSIERWVQNYERQQAATVEKMVEEWLAADSTVDAAEARRKAYDRYDKNWQTEYAIKYRPEAKKLFDQAWEMHEIAKSLERLAIQPVPIEFAKVPKLFNGIADRLYANAV